MFLSPRDLCCFQHTEILDELPSSDSEDEEMEMFYIPKHNAENS